LELTGLIAHELRHTNRSDCGNRGVARQHGEVPLLRADRAMHATSGTHETRAAMAAGENCAVRRCAEVESRTRAALAGARSDGFIFR
jgi:hypothetical protein